MTMTATPPARRRTRSRGDFTARLLEHLADEELAALLERMDPSTRSAALKHLLLRPPRGRPDAVFAGKVRETALTFCRSGLLFRFCECLVERAADEASLILGDRYHDPSIEDIERLTPVLIERCGTTVTRLLYAVVVDDERPAANKIRELLEHGPLAIPCHVPSQSPCQTSATLVNAVDPAVREQRRARDRVRRAARATRVAQVTHARRRPTHRPKRVNVVSAQVTTPHAVTPPAISKRVHPHIAHYRGFSGTGADVGAVVVVFIPFSGLQAGDGKGKIRPALVIASNRSTYIVRPLYSNARHYAGAWRAVHIGDWREAGLQKRSFVGDELHRVKRSACRRIGRFTLMDWNRVCLGEVNSADS